jgi:predicted AAA+ superfamily ATPase
VIPRRFKPPKKESYFLFGPRGTGKTTWLRKEYPKALWVDLLDPEEERKFSMHPELLKELVLAFQSSVVVVDEVQKVPGILDVVYGLIEMKKGWQFILISSS